ncbi:unnamed protein product [Arctia plantaginis]|uniref:Uncharacterized protein n=1 Tax=Arctia plantaginis TaxID=874455 RepID=A0A8S0ZMH4_ARCPL|nr:unnamed protein product [Arctia plantaginis]
MSHVPYGGRHNTLRQPRGAPVQPFGTGALRRSVRTRAKTVRKTQGSACRHKKRLNPLSSRVYCQFLHARQLHGAV